MSHLSKCSFCDHGITDDQGSRCGAQTLKLLADPGTPGLVRRTVETDCGNANRRFEDRMHPRISTPEMMVIA